jgi:hypothetical protein
LNWADFSQPVNELYQTKITQPSPLIFAILNGGSKRRIILADLVSPRGKTLGKYSPSDSAGRGGTLGVRFGLAHFSNGFWFFDDFSKLT